MTPERRGESSEKGDAARMERPEGNVTIAKIAELAGTSKMTVSRVINKKGNVAEKTRRRIEKVMREMDYSPNVFAQGLATKKTGILGLVAGGKDFGSAEGFQNIIFGVENEAIQGGYDVLFMAGAKGQNLLDHIRPSLVEGVVLFGSRMDPRLAEYFAQRGIPLVVIGRRNWGDYHPPYYSPDYFTGYQQVTRYLLSLGHRRIAVVGGYLDFEADLDKYQGYWSALEEACIARDPGLEVQENHMEEISALLEGRSATALIISGAAAWKWVMEEIVRKKYRIPEDFSLVLSGLGMEYEAMNLRQLLRVEEITRLEFPDYEMGVQAVRYLLRQLSGEGAMEEAPDHLVPMQFVQGDSCGRLSSV